MTLLWTFKSPSLNHTLLRLRNGEKKMDWLNSLSKSMDYFESIEEYEKCKEIKDLIKNIKDDVDKSNKSEG